jgi:hypothetical protein
LKPELKFDYTKENLEVCTLDLSNKIGSLELTIETAWLAPPPIHLFSSMKQNVEMREYDAD